MDWEREKKYYILKDTNNELELLKEIFSDKENIFLNKLKYFKDQLKFNKFLCQSDKSFYESQIFYYENELILLKTLQLKILSKYGKSK